MHNSYASERLCFLDGDEVLYILTDASDILFWFWQYDRAKAMLFSKPLSNLVHELQFEQWNSYVE